MANPFVHIELSTTDLKKAEKFYKGLFGWNLKPMPGMNYTMIDVGKGVGGGMQKAPMPGMPSAWLPYVEVDDVKKTLAKAGKAGARIDVPYTPIGGNMGALGVMTDPTGATIGVWEKAAAAAPEPKRAAKAAPKAAKKAPPKAKAAKKAARKAKK